MKHIFYFFAIFAILWELAVIFSPVKVYDFVKRFKSVKGKDYSPTQLAWFCCMIGYSIWTLAGFFTSQWLAFLLLFAISPIPKPHYVLKWLDGVVTFVGLVFIIINAYHLHIDLLEVVLKWVA